MQARPCCLMWGFSSCYFLPHTFTPQPPSLPSAATVHQPFLSSFYLSHKTPLRCHLLRKPRRPDFLTYPLILIDTAWLLEPGGYVSASHP